MTEQDSQELAYLVLWVALAFVGAISAVGWIGWLVWQIVKALAA